MKPTQYTVPAMKEIRSQYPELEDGTNDNQLSAKRAFIVTRRAFQDLEAAGASQFDIFNALADLFYERGEPEISELMAEAAYRVFQKQ